MNWRDAKSANAKRAMMARMLNQIAPIDPSTAKPIKETGLAKAKRIVNSLEVHEHNKPGSDT